MPRPCEKRHPEPEPAKCRWCKLFTTDERYRRLWSGLPQVSCKHLGPATGETRQCGTCLGKKEVPLHACGKHLACTTQSLVSGVACCRTCDDREE